MNGVEQHSGCIWISLFMAAGIFLVWKLGVRVARSWGINVPRDMTSWQDEVERHAIEAIRADLYSAQCRAALVELIGKVPADFDPTLLYGGQVAAGVHRAAVVEAEQQGIIRSGTYQRVYGRPIDEMTYGEGPFDGDGEHDRAPVILDEVRRRRERREDRPLARREVRDSNDAFDPFAEPIRSRESRDKEKERPSVQCSWSDGKLVPTTGRGGRRASA
jgi:hypothetical protein